MTNVIVVKNDDQLQTEIINVEYLVVVMFGASWATPSLEARAIFEQLNSSVNSSLQVKYIYADIDDTPNTGAQYQILSIPTFIFWKSGQIVSRLVGKQTKEKLVSAVESLAK
ncbi:thioredoxin family protein [Bacillus pacificus]|uniref:thioredoxin family protein n=1 Tax=Bacillus pacificus TaxID=2026187 RepID=UPI003D1D3B95